MDLEADDEVLRALADGKSMDYEQWPSLLTRLIPRLEKIIQEDFPPPSSKPATSTISSSSNPPSSPPPASDSPQNKENAPPQPTPTASLPTPIQDLITSITSTLTSLFTKHPPHTIQRLAELILQPTQHYRSLPAYLHALDRVVHVTSGAHTFPLPPAIPDPSSLSLLSNGTASSVDPLSISWGNPAASIAPALGSDESLGGALLTPISWLNRNGSSTGSHSPLEGEVRTESTEMIDGPNGMGGVETVSVSVNGISSTTAQVGSDSEVASLRAEGGITQGELLRQEQRAGVVPAAQLGGRGDSDGLSEEDELPHARGPEEIGMEDMGPQHSAGSATERGAIGMQGIDIEAAVGRRLDPQSDDDEEDADKQVKDEVEAAVESKRPSTPKRDADEEMGGEEKRVKSDDVAKSEDMEIVDADGKAADEKKFGEEGETKGPDAVDATTV
ncbi:hypothetical protein ONS95_000143 [Cadophora gregata]|uniref:uncharacterized protein n=1 Tax=Cadophora gregata TaxID=51156 RepID=UPI0026DACA6A|nr:uncharacterized protein ONS95_000143 [Cadophora gregata]KAK0115582.1 hypothetical protein ONS96_014034 [Cadophora gregata f. sp. sojae]KAK0128162.1 hypothetical protein ONS95_000143 [Cadophora gregata]